MNALNAQLSQLEAMVRKADAAERGPVLMALADILITQGARILPPHRVLIGDLLATTLAPLPLAQRRALADRLAPCADAPPNVIRLLARDTIEVAQPVLAQSPVLTFEDLAALAAEGSDDHACALAARPDLPAACAGILIGRHSENVLLTLINNHTARLASGDLARLVSLSQYYPALHMALLLRDDLPAAQAWRLADWGSETLKALIVERYGPRPAPPGETGLYETLEIIDIPAVGSPPVQAAARADALHAAGRLHPALLIKALHDRDLVLCAAYLARLADLPAEEARTALTARSVLPLARACRTIGVDQVHFETLFALACRLQNRPPRISHTERAVLTQIFAPLSGDEAPAASRACA